MKYSAIFSPVRVLTALAATCGWHFSATTMLAGPTEVQMLDHVAGEDMQLGYNLAINASTGRLYVGGAYNSGSDSGGFKIIDTTTNLVLPDPTDYSVFRFGYDDLPQLAVDAAAGRYYILAGYDKQIAIVDAATDTLLSTVDLSLMGAAPLQGIAVNSTTHTLYVTQGQTQNASGRTGSVFVIDGTTGAVTATVAVNSDPSNLAVDETLNRVYVATADYNAGSTAADEIDVIDGASLTVAATVLVSATIPLQSYVVVNPQTHRVYANLATTTDTASADTLIAVIDGAAGTVLAQVDLGNPYVEALAVDPSTNRIFVGGEFADRASVHVFDGVTNAQIASIVVSRNDSGVFDDLTLNALLDDPATGRLYVLSYTQVNVIDASSLTRLPDVEIPLYDDIDEPAAGGNPVQQKSAVDPGLNRLYTVNDAAGSLTVIDLAAGSTIHNVPLAAAANDAGCVDVNTATHQIYVSSPQEGVVAVIDGPSATQTAAIAVGGEPRELAVDSTRNLVYVSTTGGLVIIDGAAGTVVNTLSSVVSRQYFTGAGNLYYDHTAVAVNPVTGRVYVTGYTTDANYEPHLELDVIDGASAAVIDRLAPAPSGGDVVTGTLAINTVTNKIYLASGVTPGTYGSYYTGLYEIDGATDAVRAIAPPSDGEGSYLSFDEAALAVNTALNRVYIAYYDGANFTGLLYYDVATSQFTSFGTSYPTPVLTFDNVHDRLYETDNAEGDGQTIVYEDQPYTAPAFFAGETALGSGVYYLTFPSGNYFGYYSFLTDPNYIYHFDLGYEYVFDANDGQSGVYFYDFTSNDFFYTSPGFPFPYLYDFGLGSTVYYYPDPNNAGHYNTNGVRYFYVFSTGQIISK